jgi:hypothetical protein
VRFQAIAKTIMYPKTLLVMSGVSGVMVLFADGTLHASNVFESEEIDATKATRRVKAVAVVQAVVSSGSSGFSGSGSSGFSGSGSSSRIVGRGLVMM